MPKKLVLLLIVLAALCAGPVEAAGDEAAHAPAADNPAPAQPSAEPAAREQPAQDSEGAQQQYPGVTDSTVSGGDNADVTMHYPIMGNEKIDADVAAFARDSVASFEKMLQEDGGERPESYASYELIGNYDISRPNDRAVSVIFSIYSYTGGAHGMREVTCLNYSLADGRRLGLGDLFARPQQALELMSAYARARLPEELGQDNVDEDMLMSGTAPDAANFANLTLLPDGVRIEFEPYQVAPWSAGLPQISMPLDELWEAGPSRDIWPDAREPQAGQENGETPGRS